MNDLILKNKPLVEAILEMRWQLQNEKGPVMDPDYKFVIGRLFDKIQSVYPFYEPLPTSNIPDDMIAGVVQYRFRKGKNEWPLVQIGSGVLTLNETDNYSWSDFEKRIINLVTSFYSVYPNPAKLNIASMILRYRNVINFDFDKDDIYEFLKNEMGINISLNAELFEEEQINKKPLELVCNFCYRCQSPMGTINLKIARGKNKETGSQALIWDNFFYSRIPDIPQLPSELESWLNQAHNVAGDWFLKLISNGSLLEKFK